MKFSYNSSPSSASYTTTNYDDNVCESKPTAGCIHSILRRFLCFNTSLSTHHTDHFNAEAALPCRSLEDAESDIGEASPATPGLVARLMGLDSMPVVNHKDINSIRRTKSMDSLRDVELVQRKHRHVKSTMSFRDAPTFLELEDEDFFILSFECPGKNKESRSKLGKSDLGFSEMRTKRSEMKNGDKRQSRLSDKENKDYVSDNNSKHPRKVVCPMQNCHENSSSPEIQTQQIKKPINKVETIGGRLRKKKKDQNCSPVKKVETECDSENASPVSVLEFSELPIEFEVTSAVTKARLTSSNSRRILFEELKNNNSTRSTGRRINNDDQEAKTDGDRGAQIWKRLMKHGQNNGEMWDEGCSFAETDVKQTKWMHTGVLDSVAFDEINATFEFEILDQLLQDLVHQLFFL
ncbi:VARLMGL domain-containing protein [Heracleum sosnowskyi]|uniref:VARLMGL domain-containing protein n=1 Tax=Heracleum sosnowskyi TaxID=360622 RepID=A0AAD8M2I3_9APIA|nr:VARLMGL domain-containing protein [Heracleum sosnowskyi]